MCVLCNTENSENHHLPGSTPTASLFWILENTKLCPPSVLCPKQLLFPAPLTASHRGLMSASHSCKAGGIPASQVRSLTFGEVKQPARNPLEFNLNLAPHPCSSHGSTGKLRGQGALPECGGERRESTGSEGEGEHGRDTEGSPGHSTYI